MKNTLRNVAAFTFIALSVGCAPPPEEEAESGEQAIEFDPSFQKIIDTYGVFNQYLGYAKAAYAVFDFMYNPPWSRPPSPLAIMQQEIQLIHSKIAGLENKLVETNQYIDAVSLDAKRTSLVTVRGQLKSAIDLAQMQRFDNAEGPAAAAANSLSEQGWHFYELPARGGGKRFDPRISTPTFIESVTAWVGIRAGALRPLDDVSRGNLRTYADHLSNIANRIEQGVTCSRSCFSRWTKQRDPHCIPRHLGPDETPEDQCPEIDVLVENSQMGCRDAITGSGETLLNVERLADFCPDSVRYEGGHFWEPLPELAVSKASSWYPLPVYRELAATWTKLANQVVGAGSIVNGFAPGGVDPGGTTGPSTGPRKPVAR